MPYTLCYMQDYGLVSIITPSYNTAGFIAETIRSVESQTYTNWEMIIVDDCSSDSTDEIMKPLLSADKRIKYVKMKETLVLLSAETRVCVWHKANGWLFWIVMTYGCQRNWNSS